MRVVVYLDATLRLNYEAVAQAVGLPIKWVGIGGPVFEVTAPAGWGARELSSYLIKKLGPTLRSIEAAPDVQPAAPLGGCNCLGRR